MKQFYAKKFFALTFLIATLGLYGCENGQKLVDETKAVKAIDEKAEVITLGQGWSKDEGMDFYRTSQGSQLLPYSWFMALEQSDNNNLFRDDAYVRQLGYIPQPVLASINPDGLPIGFVKDDNMEAFLASALSATRLSSNEQDVYTEYREWLGLTCAACHTSEITYNDQTLRIDGGPPMSDFQTMTQKMSAALTATANDEDKLTRFAKNVLAEGGYNETERQRLKQEIVAYTAWLNDSR